MLGWVCALLVAGCSDPAGVVEQRPESIVFGPATLTVDAPDFLQPGFGQSLGVDGAGRYHYTFERQSTLGLGDGSASNRNLWFGETFHVLPYNTIRASVHGGEVVLTLRSHLGFDLVGRDSSAVVRVAGSWWGGEGEGVPVVAGAWYMDDVDLADGAGLALRAPVVWTGVLDVLHTSYSWVARWRMGEEEVPAGWASTLTTSIRGSLDLDSLTLRLQPRETASVEAAFPAHDASVARVDGTAGTMHLAIRNPTGAHFVLAARADGGSDPLLIDVPPGETTAELALDHVHLLRAAAYGFSLLVELRPGEESVEAHFAPDRPIEVEATLRVDVPPAS